MYNKYIYLLLILYTCYSCQKFVDVPPPKNQLVDQFIFSDSITANSAINGIYISMMQTFALNISSGGLTVYTGLTSDELNPTSNNEELKEFFNNAISSENSINERHFWNHSYKLIYNTNACIEGLTKSTNLTLNFKNRLLGEVKFVRAFIYFNLVNLYGPVPLIYSTNYKITRNINRTPIDSVYNEIISELKEAKELMGNQTVLNRPGPHAINALLAKVYLYSQKWDEAENISTDIITSGIYHLEPNINNIFLSANMEAIWMLYPVFSGNETWEGYFILPSNPSTIPLYKISDELLNEFETGDNRKLNWIRTNTINGIDYSYPYKYKLRTTIAAPKENYVVFRLAEQYLIRAEARIHQNNIAGAQFDLNIIRNRSNLENTLADDKSTLLSAIEQERRVELFCEWGNRWFDLKRWKKANNVLSYKSDWQATDTLFPIPQIELGRNPKLYQNPGY